MESVPAGLVPLLRPAIEACRRALRDLDAKEVPAALQRVTSSSGGRLPPPLRKSVLDHLDANEWLRTKASEAWDGLDVASPSPDVRASSLFLARPDGWWRDLAILAAGAAQADGARRLERAEAAVASSREEAAEARRRERAARSAAEQRARTAQAETAALRTELASERDQDRRAAEREEGRVASLEATVAELRRELEEAEATVASFRAQAQRARRDRAAALREAAKGSQSIPHEPLDLARHLDAVAAAARRTALPAAEEAGRPEAMAVPAGIAPDRIEAVDWLVRQPVPFTLLVDGYNVILTSSTGAGGTARRRLIEALGRLRSVAVAPARVVVVFDSADEAGSVERGPGGVEIRFPGGGRTADEEITALAAVTQGAVIVVSSDREVRELAAASGAIGLWSEALAAWLQERA